MDLITSPASKQAPNIGEHPRFRGQSCQRLSCTRCPVGPAIDLALCSVSVPESAWRKRLPDFREFGRAPGRCWTNARRGCTPSFSNWHKFAHFWILVGRSFARNRCPVRASALAYATVLALIPMLAVVVSITSSLLKKEGEEQY